MKNTPGQGGCSRPRGGSMTGSEGSASGEMESEQGSLGSTDASSTAGLGNKEDHNHPKSMTEEGNITGRDVGYGCKPSRLHLASDPGPTLHPSKLDAVTAAGIGKGVLNEGSRGSYSEPPITKLTLSELDIPRIVYNPKLRHDVDFDPDLHFRPNLDGESGRRKAQKANDFWNRLRAQIEDFMVDPIAFESELERKEWCLQPTLQTIGEILGTLVPPEDRPAVEEVLNVELLMQQFRKGVADLEKLSLWLARTLKSHCAPMRDEWVDEIVVQLSLGDRARDVDSLVQGLQSLLGVLEAMKLDVANHQIRCLRPLLIQDTVEFEQTFFMKKIALCKIDVTGAYAWFQDAKSFSDVDQPQTSTSQGDMWAFFRGFADLLIPSRMGASIPDTFMFDEERIDKLRLEISDAINLDICTRLLRNTNSKNTAEELQITTISAPRRSPLRPNTPMPNSETQNSAVKSVGLSAVPKFSKGTKVSPFPKVTKRLDKPADLDESFQGLDLDSEDDESDTESPLSTRRTSFSSTTSTSITSPLSRSMELPVATADSRLRRAILAIVNDAPGNNRWQQSSSDIALELLRSTPSHDDLSRLESQLTLHLCNPISSVFQKSETNILTELYPLLSDLAARYAPLTVTQLFEVATSPRPLPYQARISPHTLNEVAKQMAHIGILHWRVWAPLVYLVDPDEAGHVTDATDPASRKVGEAWGQVAENSRRPSPERQDSISESIPTGS